MKSKFLFILFFLIITSALVAVVSASAFEGDANAINWWTVDGGGAISSMGGSYSLGGSIGQPDGGVSSGGDYDLVSGFWGSGETGMLLFLPLVLR